MEELRSIVDYSTHNPSIDEAYFPNVMSSYYWSATTYAYNTGLAWGIDFSNGDDSGNNKTNSFYVRAVRSGQSVIGPFDPLIISPPTKVTTINPQTDTEIANCPVVFKDNNFTLNFPAYNAPVDLYMALLNPAGKLLFVDAGGNLTTEFSPYAVGTTSAVNSSFSVADSPLASDLYGQCGVYWLVAPSNGGDIIGSLEGAYELGFYSLNLAELPADENVFELLIEGSFGNVVSLYPGDELKLKVMALGSDDSAIYAYQLVSSDLENTYIDNKGNLTAIVPTYVTPESILTLKLRVTDTNSQITKEITVSVHIMEQTIIGSGTVSSEGGTIVDNANSISVEFPPGVVDGLANISIISGYTHDGSQIISFQTDPLTTGIVTVHLPDLLSGGDSYRVFPRRANDSIRNKSNEEYLKYN